MIKKHTQNNVDEPGPQLVVEPPPQGQFPLSDLYSIMFLFLHLVSSLHDIETLWKNNPNIVFFNYVSVFITCLFAWYWWRCEKNTIIVLSIMKELL